VNGAFASAAIAAGGNGETCWVHDYQLALAPALAREGGYRGRIGFFLHTPFPDVRVASAFLDEHGRARLAEFVHGMLGADVVGLQCDRDVERFLAASSVLCGVRPAPGGVVHEGRTVEVMACPVGIDFDEVAAAAATGELPAEVAGVTAHGLPLVVGLERADFTKGIPERLNAVARAFDDGRAFAYVGVAAPTRQGIAAYDRLQDDIARAAEGAERAAARGRGQFVQLQAAIPWECVVALQREAAVVFTSSLADGMNLVPLQAVAAQSSRPALQRGVVVSGRDAGVAAVLAPFAGDGFEVVDPLDPNAMADTLARALERRCRPISDRLVAAVRENDAQAWATRFLAALEGGQC
jgi:trehalose 6-phosphate synthase